MLRSTGIENPRVTGELRNSQHVPSEVDRALVADVESQCGGGSLTTRCPVAQQRSPLGLDAQVWVDPPADACLEPRKPALGVGSQGNDSPDSP